MNDVVPRQQVKFGAGSEERATILGWFEAPRSSNTRQTSPDRIGLPSPAKDALRYRDTLPVAGAPAPGEPGRERPGRFGPIMVGATVLPGAGCAKAADAANQAAARRMMRAAGRRVGPQRLEAAAPSAASSSCTKLEAAATRLVSDRAGR
jgi:hypothetical protein